MLNKDWAVSATAMIRVAPSAKRKSGLAHREFGGKLLNARSPQAPRQQDGVGRARHHGVEIGIDLARIERMGPDDERRDATLAARVF